MSFFGRRSGGPVYPKKPLTLLGSLLPAEIYTMPIVNESVFPKGSDQPAMRKIMGQYEAGLAQAAYFSRLMYAPLSDIRLALCAIHTNPLVFNTVLAIVRAKRTWLGVLKKAEFDDVGYSVKQPFIGPSRMLITKDTPCYMQILDYRGKDSGCPYPGEKVLYIVFRGTSTMRGVIEDSKINSRRLSDAFDRASLGGISGAKVFEAENGVNRKGGVLNPIHPFGAFRGFVSTLTNIIPEICGALESTFLKESPDRIIVTGHSLGGANATLVAMLLAGFRRAGVAMPQIHCISFGCSKLLTDYSRNVFNSLLLDGNLTLDRVANRVRYLIEPGVIPGAKVNVFTVIPPYFDHAGFSPLKTEISKSLTATGRTKNISELRKLFAGIRREKTMFSASEQFNGIPTYAEFLACFDGLLADNYKLILKTPYGTVYDSVISLRVRLFISKQLGIKEEEIPIPKLADDEAIKTAEAMRIEDDPKPELSPEQAAAEAAAEGKGEGEDAPLLRGGAKRRTRRRIQKAGSYTSEYKELSLKNGSNQVVYMPQYNISGISAHTSYCAVSFWGMLGNLGATANHEDEVISGATERTAAIAGTATGRNNLITGAVNQGPPSVGGTIKRRRAPTGRKTRRRRL